MKKASNKQKELANKIKDAKKQITVDVIKYNKVIEELKKNILISINSCHKISENSFNKQRQLIARKRMTERVLVSTLKMLDNNQLYLWMIDDEIIKEELQ